MSLTSIVFFIAFLVSLAVYYVVPRRAQWIVLLVYSVYFLIASSTWWTVFYFIGAVIVATLCANGIARAKAAGEDRRALRYLLAGILSNLVLLAVLKYSTFVVQNVNIVSRLCGHPLELTRPTFAAPLGISFYTMTLIAYLVDCYWGLTTPYTNVLQNALYLGYWPALTSGPIQRHADMRGQYIEGHAFDWTRVTYGLQRMLWGIFKKLVISMRVGSLVDSIYGDMTRYQGLYIWIAAALFLVQLYTDFSGCMDIIIGASECYGIVLPENFRSPFLSLSVQEFWQRWHITLGHFMKDYVMYPILRTNAWRRLTKWTKRTWGKQAAKVLPTQLATLILWLACGLWHGGDWKYLIGNGIWMWFIILLEQLLGPVLVSGFEHIGVHTDTWGWRMLQRIRTFLAIMIGNMFFHLGSVEEVITALKAGFSIWNPWIFIDDSFYNMELSRQNVMIIPILLVILGIVDVLSEREDVREIISRQNLVLRWIIYIALIWAIAVFGIYGSQYNAGSFIYGAF